MNRQPRDILYLIIAYLEYTPDTARLGRVCKYMDSIPCWYERSGHRRPHGIQIDWDDYVLYQDGKIKEFIWNAADCNSYYRCSSNIRNSFNGSNSCLIAQLHLYSGINELTLELSAITGMPLVLTKKSLNTTTTITVLRETPYVRVQLMEEDLPYIWKEKENLLFAINDTGMEDLFQYDDGVFSYLYRMLDQETEQKFGVGDMFTQ
jgi:hypothetical protein